MEPGKLIPNPNATAIQAVTDAEPIRPGYGNYGNYTELNEDQGWIEYWYIVLKHKWLIGACVVLGTVIAAIAAFKATPIYEAVGRVAINRENNDALGIKNPNDSSSVDDWDLSVLLDTHAKILASDPIALEVIHKLGLGQAAPEAGSGIQVKSRQDQDRESAQLASFKNGLQVKPLPRTRILEIHYFSPDPQLAARVVNSISEVYVEHNFKSKYESTMQTSDWISKQLSDLLVKVEASQEALVRYQKEHGIVGLDEKQNIVTEKLQGLNKELTEAEADRAAKEALYRIAQQGRPDLVTTGPTENSTIAQLRLKEADLKQRVAELNTQFGPSYPKVIEANEQLRQVQASIRQESQDTGSRARNAYLAAVQREKLLRAALEQQKLEANKLNESAIQYNILKRDAESNRQLYEGLLQKLKEAGVIAGLKSSNIQIVDPARVPTSPARPNIPRNITLAFLFSLAFGIMLSFAVEVLDNTLRTPDQVQMVASLPPLAIIPAGQLGAARNRMLPGATTRRLTPADQVGLVSFAHPRSALAESYRALRTSLLLSSTGAPPKVILVTSALAQEGKTTTAVNSAIVLAQKNAKVLLIDADMRRPSIHRVLGIKQGPGLSNFLGGKESAENVVQSYPQVPNLSVIPAGPVAAHPAEMLGSVTMSRALARWREQYDHIIIDTPPSLNVTDAVLLSVEADTVILVIRSGRTTKQALRRARDLLLRVNAKLAGVVVNAVDLSGADHYYYYGYTQRKRYGYGYGYGDEDSAV
ncbi:MAG TPA: polysaccharide biosynthesis tyrosine autokinase [Terriglobales bacterium]|nr:polysaccharide biosynthesis tyrosine autokinase [Terriglobales bacterium]